MPSSSPGAVHPPHTSLVSVEVDQRKTRRRLPRSPRAGGRSRKHQDGRRKTESKGITRDKRHDTIRAENFAYRIGRRLQTTLDFHPVHLDAPPDESLDAFFAGLRNRIATWCRRKIDGSWWVWTRENYAGEGREHLHLVMHLPPRFRPQLKAAIRRWYPGNPELVHVGERKAFYNPATGRWTDGLSYRMKQLRGDAAGPPGPTRLYRETKSRHDGAPVAPVYGKRSGVSDSLSAKAEDKWRAERS